MPNPKNEDDPAARKMKEVKAALKDAKEALGTAKAHLAQAEQVVAAKATEPEVDDLVATSKPLPSSNPPAPMPPAVVEEATLEQTGDQCPPLTGVTTPSKPAARPKETDPSPDADEHVSDDEETEHVEVDSKQVGEQLAFLEPLGDCPVEEAHHPAYFPSKVGGKPVWLDPRKPAHPGDVQCRNCGKQLQFLLQWYSSFERAPHGEAFHRTLYLYICRDPKCIHHNTAVVLRQQLPRENPFYLDDSEPEGTDTKDWPKWLPKTCELCGSAAPSRCSRCKAVSYCSKEHQRLHWSLGHKECCLPDGDEMPLEKFESNYAILQQKLSELDFPIVDLVSEPEPGPKPLTKDEQRRYKKLLSNFKNGEKKRKGAAKKKALEDKEDPDDGDLRDVLNPVDNYWDEFIMRVKREPGQCMRSLDLSEPFVDRPLWPCERLRCDYVPPCEGCGQERRWELQILPQFIYQIKEQKLDWNTIVVYCCPDSCTKSKLEFVHVQAVVAQHDIPIALAKKVNE